jgi:hypothetical protein
VSASWSTISTSRGCVASNSRTEAARPSTAWAADGDDFGDTAGNVFCLLMDALTLRLYQKT